MVSVSDRKEITILVKVYKFASFEINQNDYYNYFLS